MLSFQLTSQMVSDSEIKLFSEYLSRCGVDAAVRDVYRSLTGVRRTHPA